MSRFISTTVLAASLALACGTAAAAAPAEHDTFVESWAGQQHLSAAENMCGPWAATLHESRSGEYRIVQAPAGQAEGELHVNGAVDGRIVLTPDAPGLPTYSGSYREKVGAIITGVDEHGEDVARVAHFRLRAPLAGSDGSSLVLTLSGRITMNARGETVVESYASSCA